MLALECSWLLQLEPGIATVTYFDGSIEDVAPKTKDRFRAAVDANPWLAEKLVYSRNPRRLQLAYSARTKNTDAGNYESVVFYDKAGYARCETVRKCLTAGPPHVGWFLGLPGFLEGGALQAVHHLCDRAVQAHSVHFRQPADR